MRAFDLALAGLVLLGLLFGAGCNTSVPYAPMGSWEEILTLYAEAASATDGPFLSEDPNASTIDRYTVASDLHAGAVSTVRRVQGEAPTDTAVFVSPASGVDRYLNLSKPIVGVLWFADTSTLAANRAQMIQVRLEAFSGANRIGGAEFTYDGSAQLEDGFMPFYFHFRPETSVLEGSEEIRLEATRRSGALDFFVGTHGLHQSSISFHHFLFDPLGSSLYVKNGKLVVTGPGADEDDLFAGVSALQASGAYDRPGSDVFVVGPEESEEGSSSAYLAASFVPLAVGLLRRTRWRAMLALVLLFGGAFSGCLDLDRGEETSLTSSGGASPTARQEFQDNDTLGKLGAGAIHGRVRDSNNITIPYATAGLQGTAFSKRADGAGRFVFEPVKAGNYRLRIDADKFDPLETDVEVKTGKITHVNVTLTADVPLGQTRHRHDDWGEEKTKSLPDVEFLMASSAPTEQTGRWVSPYNRARGTGDSFDTPIPIELDTKILPGTALVEVTLEWTDGPRELGLRVATTTNATADQYFVPRASGDPFRIAIFPNEADRGHQELTNWLFFAHLPNVDSTNNVQDAPVYMGGEILMTSKIHKGVVPFEPEHFDHWGKAMELPLTFTSSFSMSGTCNLPDETRKWSPTGSKNIIPQGTLEVRGTLVWTPYTTKESTTGQEISLPDQVDWGLLYKPANVPAAKWSEGVKPVEITGSANNGAGFEFVVRPTDNEMDQFYQFYTLWQFYLDDNDPGYSTYSVNCAFGYGSSFEIQNLKAIRDPAWEDE